MAIEIRSLNGVGTQVLVEVFNDAFSDYMVPMRLTEENIAFKLHSELIDLDLSVGAFEAERLVGFMLTGVKKNNKTNYFYNAGTGVIPAYRGQRLVARMYNFAVPKWKADAESAYLLLEVIKGNEKAIKAYQSQGYTINRDLLCFKGSPNREGEGIDNLTIEKVEQLPWSVVATLGDLQPSWQNAMEVLCQMGEEVCYKIAKQEGNTVGYVAYHKNSGKLFQIAVSKLHRRKGIGTQLINAVFTALEKPLLITNVDESGQEVVRFLEGIGLEQFITQHEMVRKL